MQKPVKKQTSVSGERTTEDKWDIDGGMKNGIKNLSRGFP